LAKIIIVIFKGYSDGKVFTNQVPIGVSHIFFDKRYFVLKCRGRAFASQSLNSPPESHFANAQPSPLSPINCGCVVRFWAKHSRIKRICKVMDFCGNALPLMVVSP
jgi:hypothetical protein